VQPRREAKAGEPHLSGIADEYVLRLYIFMDEAVPVGLAERRCQVNGEAQNLLQIERLIPGPLEHTVERLAARVGENQHGSSFLTRQREGPGGPCGIKLGGERVFVLQASQGLRRRRFRGGRDCQQGRWVAGLAGPVKREVRSSADWLQNVLGSSCHLRASRSESDPAHQLNLAPGAGSGEDLACIRGEITRSILEDGIPGASQGDSEHRNWDG
jgi:hypothetical protein